MRPEIFSEAKERAKTVKERGETRLFSITPDKVEAGKQEIMVGARDAGTADTLAPVIKELLCRNYPVSLLTDQPAEKFLSEKFKMEEIKLDSPLGAIAEREPSLIISGVSYTGGPGVEFYLTKTAEGYGEAEIKDIPVVWVEDNRGVASARGILKKYPVKPDFICAFDETSKALDIARLQDAKITDLSPERIVVTGSPAFDEIAHEENRQEIQKKVREALKIAEDEIFIAWMSGLPEEDLKSLNIFINNFNKLELGGKKIVLTSRIHPSVLNEESLLSQYKKEYEELFQTFKNGKIVDTMGRFETKEVAIAADIVATEGSTEGLKAVYRGKPVLFMLLPGLAGDHLRNNVGLETLPEIKSGASIGVFKEEDTKQALKNLLDQEYQKTMLEAQQKYHKLDGQNAKRVVDAVEKLLAEQLNNNK